MMLLLIALSTAWVTINYGIFRDSENSYNQFMHFKTQREEIIKYESVERFGSNIQLNVCEEKANDILLSLKWAEQKRWLKNVTLHQMQKENASFENMRKEFEASMIYNVLRDMPKGAALQLHDIGMTKIEDIIEFTYTNNLWVCINSVQFVQNDKKDNINLKNNGDNYNYDYNYETNPRKEVKDYIGNILNKTLTQNQTENSNNTKFLENLLIEIQNISDSNLIEEQIKNNFENINKLNVIDDSFDFEDDVITNNDYNYREYLLFYFSRTNPTTILNNNKSEKNQQMDNSNNKLIEQYKWFNNNNSDDKFNSDMTCKWVLLSDLRKEYGENVINEEIKYALTIHSSDHYSEWNQKLFKIRRLLNGLIYYAPIFPKYIQSGLRNIYEDGISYVELRSELRNLYDLNGNIYNIQDTVNIIRDVSDDASIRYNTFNGVKIIYCPSMRVTNNEFEIILQNTINLTVSIIKYFYLKICFSYFIKKIIFENF